MTRVFISHSSLDNESGVRLKEQLEELKFDVFYDKDSDVGIQVGEDWEKRLIQELKACQAMVILQTENWLASRWCFAEFVLARSLGKKIFPVIDVKAGDSANIQIAPEIQSLDLRRDYKSGISQLERQLLTVGLGAQQGFTWDHKRPPYPGLAAFEEEDAAVYFGRDRETNRLIEELRRIKQVGGNRLLVILGASGSGKSSLLRAGVIPRLKRNSKEWIVLSPFRPGINPGIKPGIKPGFNRCIKLSVELAKAMNRAESWEMIYEDIKSADQSACLHSHINGLLTDIQVAASATEAQILLSIDQAEELFSGVIDEDLSLFYRILKNCLDGSLPMIGLMTLRSDFLNRLQLTEDQIGWFLSYPLGPFPNAHIGDIITGPASVAGIEVEDGLVRQAIKDAVTEDALPLLAFVLERLHARSSPNKRLILSIYQAMGNPAIGLSPIENAVNEVAEKALKGASDESIQALREAFIPDMVRINESGEYVRQPAEWQEMPALAWPLLEKLINERVLFSRLNEENSNRIVEVAHEALLRKWPLLVEWLSEEKEYLSWYQRLDQEYKDWDRAGRQANDDETLLTGGKLKRARGWLEERPRLKQHLKLFIQTSIYHDEAQARQKRRIRNLVTSFFVLAGILTVVFPVNSWFQFRKAEAAVTEGLLSNHLVLLNTDPQKSLINGLAAAKQLLDNSGGKVNPNERGRALALSISLAKAATANWVATEPIPTNQGMVMGLVLTKGGGLISGGSDGTLKHWRDLIAIGKPIKSENMKISSLAMNVHGELVVGDNEGKIKFWKDNQAIGLPISTGHGVIYALITLGNGDLLSGGNDGNLKRWRNGKQIAVIPTGHIVKSLLELKSGEILSGGDDGMIRRWKDENQLGDPIDTKHGDIWGLAELKNGEIISGGQDGFLRRWRNSTMVGEAINTGQGGVMSLILLGNGDLISGGKDGTLRLWRNEKPSSFLVPTKQTILKYLYELKNGELISAGKEGTFRRWQGGKPVDDQPIPTNQGGINSLVVRDNDVLTGGNDGTIRSWRNGKQIDSITTEQGKVVGLASLSSSQLFSLGEDRAGVATIRRWQGTDPLGGPRRRADHDQAFILSRFGSGRLISGDVNGRLQIWKNDGTALAPAFATNSDIASLLILDRDDFVTGNMDGTLGRWHPDGRAKGKVISGKSQEAVLTLARISSNELISGGADGTLQRWRIETSVLTPIETPILTEQDRIYGLLALSTGELVSGGSNSLNFYSLPAVVSAACKELKDFRFSADDLPSKRAGELCTVVNRQP
jgi:WD40 repeat protein